MRLRRRLAKYKTADYADDPDYVRRKREELKAAYESAVGKAERMFFEKFREDAATELREELTEEAAEEFAEDAAEAAQTIFKEREKRQSGRKLEYEWKKRQMKEEESGSAFEDVSFTDDGRGDFDSEEERIRRRSRKEYEREKVRASGRNRDDEKTGFQKPDLSSLKGKAQQLKQYTQRRTDEIKTELHDYREEEKEYSKEDENDTPMEILNEVGESKMTSKYTQRRTDEIKTELHDYREEEKEYSKEDENDTPMEILNEVGESKMTSKAVLGEGVQNFEDKRTHMKNIGAAVQIIIAIVPMEILNEVGESKMTSKAVLGEGVQNFEDKRTHMKNIGAAVQIIIAIVIAIAGFAITAGDDDITDDDYYYDDTEIVYEDSDYTEDNERIRELGYAFSDFFNSGDTVYSEEWAPVSDNDENLNKAADRFAKLYTGKDSMSALCDVLYNGVGAFPAAEYDYVKDQVAAVLNYYGFPPPEEVMGTVNPYTGKSIRNLTQYLRYLNRFYGGHFESEMF